MRVSFRLLDQAAQAASRINTMQDMQAKVVKTAVQASELGKTTAYCRCWQSQKFPLCDGSHAKHNEATGDNVGPLVIKKDQ